MGIRFITINNGIDSDSQQDSDFTPFLNIINEWYAKDTSKKIRAVFKAKGQSGKPLSVNPPYGYLKSPDNKYEWVVDEAAAKVVREAFRMCMAGYGPSQIAAEFADRKILNPTAHAKALGIGKPDRRVYTDDYRWSTSTITRMLSRQEYLGSVVNFKSHRKSYKQKSRSGMIRPSGRSLRIPMRRSSTAKPLILFKSSATADADRRHWARCRFSRGWSTAPIAAKRCSCRGIPDQKHQTNFLLR